jgi:hypothetical protein
MLEVPWNVIGSLIVVLATLIVVVVYVAKKVNNKPCAMCASVKLVENSDVVHLCFMDVFSWKFIFKLERKFGVYKALTMFVFLYSGVFGVFMCMLYLLDVVTWRMVVVFTVFLFVFTFVIGQCLRTGRWPGRLERYL